MVAESDKWFIGSIPMMYEAYLVPLIFEPYAAGLARRVAQRNPARVLEIAAGTGIVSRALVSMLPPSTSITVTDLNHAMLAHARAIGTSRAVDWSVADALRLPFRGTAFDVVVCQFGVMFLPDKVQAFAEARRVLRPGGAFIFNVWDRIEDNEFADVTTESLAALFPDKPPRFLARTPHGYHDRDVVVNDLARAGFSAKPKIETEAARSVAATADQPAIAYCQGTPLRNEIEARDASRLVEATNVATAAITARFGPGPVDGKIQAHIVTVDR